MEKTAAGIPKNEAAAGEVNADPILRQSPLLVPEYCMKINENESLRLVQNSGGAFKQLNNGAQNTAGKTNVHAYQNYHHQAIAQTGVQRFKGVFIVGSA